MTQIENQQIKDLTGRFDSFEEGFGELKDGVKEIRDALLGNEYNEKSAYKARLEVLEIFKAKVEVKILKATIWGVAIGSIIAVLLEFLYKIASISSNLNLIKH